MSRYGRHKDKEYDLSSLECVLQRCHMPELDEEREDYDEMEHACPTCGSEDPAPMILASITKPVARRMLRTQKVTPDVQRWLENKAGY